MELEAQQKRDAEEKLNRERVIGYELDMATSDALEAAHAEQMAQDAQIAAFRAHEDALKAADFERLQAEEKENAKHFFLSGMKDIVDSLAVVCTVLSCPPPPLAQPINRLIASILDHIILG